MKKHAVAGTSPLERYRADVSRCVRCGACKAVCPSFSLDRCESRSARGRMALVEAVLKGSLAASRAYRDRLATCTSCLACEASCASGVPVSGIIQAAKEQAVEEAGPGFLAGLVGVALKHEGVMKSLAWLAPVALHYRGTAMRGRPSHGSSRLRGEDSGGGAKGRVIFFPGCAIRHFQRDIESAVVSVLSAMGYEVVIPDGLRCCGRPLLSLGDRRAAEEHALLNTRLLSSFKAAAIVTACASCGMTFKKEYPGLLAPCGVDPVPVLDIHEFLAGKVSALALEPLRARVTWHDPCHLGRGQGLAGTAREVLLSVAGVDLEEMKNPDRCCGFGGVMRAFHPDVSVRIGAEKARDILGTKASLVVTGCPGCRMQVRDALRREGNRVEVVHTVQVLARALKEGKGKDGKTQGRGVSKGEVEKVGR